MGARQCLTISTGVSGGSGGKEPTTAGPHRVVAENGNDQRLHQMQTAALPGGGVGRRALETWSSLTLSNDFGIGGGLSSFLMKMTTKN